MPFTPTRDRINPDEIDTAPRRRPEWIKVRKESIDKHGQISSVSQISLYRATAYSPIR